MYGQSATEHVHQARMQSPSMLINCRPQQQQALTKRYVQPQQHWQVTRQQQVPLLIVQVKVFTPVVNPVTPLVGLVGVVTVAVPAVTVQSPVPNVGAFAAKVAVGEQMV